MSQRDRLNLVARIAQLNPQETAALSGEQPLPSPLVDTFVENAVGRFALPLGVATNFLINDRDVLVPMAVEESSVVAAASYGAKLVRAGGGFWASCDESIMTGKSRLSFRKTNLLAPKRNFSKSAMLWSRV